jgi:putative hydrolase of the HAD superfamily
VRRRPGRGPVWLLDLDNTLHDAGAAILPRINQAMNTYIQQELGLSVQQAHDLRVQYWHRYGATLLGLISNHSIDAHDFLQRTHQFPDMQTLVQPNLKLAGVLRRLVGVKVLFTNAPAHYARAVVRALGIHRQLDHMICIEHMQFVGLWQPKPSAAMMRRTLAGLRIKARQAVLVEDSTPNLRAARKLGIGTVLVKQHLRQYRHANPHPVFQRHGRPMAVDFQIQSPITLVRRSIRRRLPT